MMKTPPVRVCIVVCCLLLASGLAMAQPEQTAAGNPPLEQPLIREGDLAVKLVEALKLGAPENETEAESILAAVDIIPLNGWIADYPVTPDIVEELHSAVGEAAESGKIAMDKEAAQKTFQDVMNDFDLLVKADTSGRAAEETAVPDYADSAAENNYYYDEGPPVVTYYAPPPDYAYLYTWVPDPFWWSDVWFPGFFILADFDVRLDRHRHRHRHDHDHDRDHDRDHGKRVSNHFADPNTGRVFRVQPARRQHGGAFTYGAGATGSRAPAEDGAGAVTNTGRRRAATGAYREFRGYGASGPPGGNRSTIFERSRNSQFERNSSSRGFRSRSNAGMTPGAGRGSPGAPRGGAGTGFHGGGGGGFHGGGGVIRR